VSAILQTLPQPLASFAALAAAAGAAAATSLAGNGSCRFFVLFRCLLYDKAISMEELLVHVEATSEQGKLAGKLKSNISAQ
jgi:hypothetical protein